MKGKTRKKMRIGLIIFCMVIMIFIFVEIFISYKCLSVKKYTIKSNRIHEKTKVVMIADLHDSSFGNDNKRLISKIKSQNPDLILMVGDMINDNSKDISVVVELIKNLKDTAPIYYAWGNQEIENKQISLKEQKEQFEAAGAVVLEEAYKDIEVNKNKIRIGGFYEYAFAVDGAGHMDTGKIPKKQRKFLEDFQNTDAFRIMMAHRPDSFVFGEAYKTWNVDLVVSGHAHGGQVVLPLVGGLYGADQGWFPKYIDGIHQFKTVKNMVITRGLGSNVQKLPRFHNVPEIVSITME